jgi:hypothetical protein
MWRPHLCDCLIPRRTSERPGETREGHAASNTLQVLPLVVSVRAWLPFQATILFDRRVDFFLS